jgi:AcrR family transcriptional regulator
VGRSGDETRERLLGAAELLFAERGIDAVTVSEITAAAGVGNNSAVAYHFGSKFGLLEAVLARHLPAIDEQRDALVAEIEPTAPDASQGLARALVEPLAAQLGTASGVRYLCIQASLLGYADRRALPPTLRQPWSRPPVKQLERITGPAFRGGDTTNDHFRVLVTSLVFHGLADYARSHPRARRADRDAFVDGLTRAVVALLDSAR